MNTQILISSRDHMPRYVEELAVETYGFDGLELVLLREDTAARRKQFLSLRHVKTIHGHIDAFDAVRFREALLPALELAHELKVPLVNMHPGSLERGGRKNVLQCYEIAKELSLKYNCTVAIEILPKPEKDKHRQQRAYDHPQQWADDLKRFKLVGTIDTTHLASWGVDPAEYVSCVGKRLAHLHVSDFKPSHEKGKRGQQHMFIGDGTIDFKRFFKALRGLSLKGTLYVTLEQSRRYDLVDHEKDLRRSLQLLKEYARVAEPSAV